LNPKLNKTLIVVSGPTASGKTAISIEIAKVFNAEIISADSRQFFRELKIGVAAPSQLELITIKHHFVGHLSISEYYNVSRFETDVIEFLSEYFNTSKFALMVGGSGLYINAVCKGIDDMPDADETLRKQLKEDLEANGLEGLRQQLKDLDPEYYRIVDRNNPNRILRALEVCIATGKPYSSLRSQANKVRDFNVIKIGLIHSRNELIKRIEKRVDLMIDAGLVEEVRSLINYRTVNALNTVGYKEIFQYLDGNCSLDHTIEKIKTNTRRYAKRQLTWFKRDNSINWFHPDEFDKIIDFIKTSKRQESRLYLF
jgi:tRNA dimethylallyltransferase